MNKGASGGQQLDGGTEGEEQCLVDQGENIGRGNSRAEKRKFGWRHCIKRRAKTK